MCVERYHHMSVVISDKILVIGGDYHGSVECYNPAQNTWSQRAPLLRRRTGFDAGASNGFVYVMGGSIRENPIETVTSIERYSMENNTWTLVLI